MKYKNNKTGDIYSLWDEAIDCTNSRDGTKVIIYYKEDDDSIVFVREAKEFYEKFTFYEP